jgi:hypothetical protein
MKGLQDTVKALEKDKTGLQGQVQNLEKDVAAARVPQPTGNIPTSSPFEPDTCQSNPTV